MSEIVTLEISETIARSARAVAEQTHRSLEAVLIEWLDRTAIDLPLDQLSDEEIIALRDSTMDATQQQELSDLLARQREDLLTLHERKRLDTLMSIYRQGMVRKAQALKIAVDRGLQPPLN